jgi:pimeloyl-ACP methyl ester carboxylesterase
MFIEEKGSGPALVLLHGSPSPVDVLAPVADAFAATRRVLTPHFPGYGKTPADAAPVSLNAQLRRLEDALLARGVTECSVVGYSLGGYRALQLAASARIRVSHAVLLGGFANFDAATREGKRQFAVALRARAVDLAAIAPQALLSPAQAAAGGPLAREVAGWATATTVENLANEQDAIAAMDDLTPVLPKLRSAIVARVGSLDVAVAPLLSEEICRAVPGAKLEVVSGCGHALLLEDREGTLASIRRALG